MSAYKYLNIKNYRKVIKSKVVSRRTNIGQKNNLIFFVGLHNVDEKSCKWNLGMGSECFRLRRMLVEQWVTIIFEYKNFQNTIQC